MSDQQNRPNEGNQGDSRELKQDELVERLMPEPVMPEPPAGAPGAPGAGPRTPPDVLRLSGFLGQDTEEGYWRLYLTPNLDTYVKVAESDVVASQELAPEFTPGPTSSAGTVLFVKREAEP